MSLTPAVIGIVVADMPASLAFYRRLGLDIPAEADTEPHVEVDLGGVRLAFDTRETIRSFDPAWTEASGGPRMSLAFRAGSPAEVDEAYAALTAAGAEGHLEPWDAFWGMRYATVHDPDGNGVDLFAPTQLTVTAVIPGSPARPGSSRRPGGRRDGTPRG